MLVVKNRTCNVVRYVCNACREEQDMWRETRAVLITNSVTRNLVREVHHHPSGSGFLPHAVF